MMIEEEVEPVKAVFNEKGGVGPARRLDDAARRRLTRLLLGKTLAELIFVSVLALAFYFAAFPPYYRGWGEVTARGIEGWAVNDRDPWQRVEVYLFVDGRFVARQTAGLSRPDVRAAGFAADEWHGYAFALPALENGEHEASVYALHGSGEGARYTLQLLGNPVRFRVEAGGAVTSLEEGARR